MTLHRLLIGSLGLGTMAAALMFGAQPAHIATCDPETVAGRFRGKADSGKGVRRAYS
jgi:hypothetical protein